MVTAPLLLCKVCPLYKEFDDTIGYLLFQCLFVLFPFVFSPVFQTKAKEQFAGFAFFRNAQDRWWPHQ